jgi:uncharacterized repeat protein (TIGR02543 family)
MTDFGKIGVDVSRVVSLMMVVSLVAGLTAFVASTASATGGAATPVATFGELQSEASSCAGVEGTPTRIALAANIPAAGDQLTVGCHVVLDLAGFALSVRNVVISGGQALTIDDTSSGETGSLTADAKAESLLAGIRNTDATLIVAGGAVTATGGGNGAGIGGGFNGAGGTTVISGGTVIAKVVVPIPECLGGGICFRPSTYGAGIGGGFNGAGGSTTISGGRVTATGGDNGAGIGGGIYQAGGTTVISGGTVIANVAVPTPECRDDGDGEEWCFVPPTYGAGIGGGFNGAGGSITISGGTVTAVGGEYGAGIGGGIYQAGGPITISGGTVTATGGEYGAGIGGGYGGGGTISISGGTVTAVGGSLASAVGPGFNAGFGSLSVSGGVLRLPSGALRIPDAAGVEVVVSGDGVIDGSAGDTKTYASIVGQGQIGNAGRILLPTANIGVAVLGRHFRVSFDRQDGGTSPDPVTVFADSFATGNRSFPTNPTRDGYVFNGWNTKADGTGASVTASTGLTALAGGTSTDGAAVAITAYAQWDSSAPITVCYPPNARVPAKARTLVPPPPCRATR